MGLFWRFFNLGASLARHLLVFWIVSVGSVALADVLAGLFAVFLFGRLAFFGVLLFLFGWCRAAFFVTVRVRLRVSYFLLVFCSLCGFVVFFCRGGYGLYVYCVCFSLVGVWGCLFGGGCAVGIVVNFSFGGFVESAIEPLCFLGELGLFGFYFVVCVFLCMSRVCWESGFLTGGVSLLLGCVFGFLVRSLVL